MRHLVGVALDEDIGHGDLTTESTIDAGRLGTGRVLAKSDLVVCGHSLAEAVFDEVVVRYGGAVRYEIDVPEGTPVAAGTVIARVSGDLRCIVIGERVALNLLMKLCGIASNTRRYVDAALPDGPRVVDTRKTTAGLRLAEKHAVRCGGGHNHRHALFDGVMVKDNHITAVGSLTEAVARAREAAHHLVRVEVEVQDLEQLEEALGTAADVILLDNMDDATLAAAVTRSRAVRPAVLLEASGNITPNRIIGLRGMDLDFVSVGGLIHQAVWADLSLKIRSDPAGP